MKKILLSTIALFAFSFSIILFQISCKKEATAQTTTTGQTPLNIIIFTKSFNTNNVYTQEIWRTAYDGSSQTKINIQLPANVVFSEAVDPKLSPEGKTIIFTAGVPSAQGTISYLTDLYTCNIDGSDVRKIVDHGTASSINLKDVK